MKRIFLLFILFCSFKTYSQSVDSTYYRNCVKILKHYPNSRINANDLFENAIEVYDSLQIKVPYELAISQAIIETSLGRTGVGKSKNNPYSINSKRGYIKYNTIREGIKAYYYIAAKRYLRCKNMEQLLNNFTSCSKKRYAKTREYERKLKKQILFFRKYLRD